MIKISRPTPKDVYPRHRLLELLDFQRWFPIIWISAPAGSGKTTLITSYIEKRKIPCLWYQLDPGDSDLATFFHYLGCAARKAAPGKRLTLPHLTTEYLQGIPAFTRRFFETLFSRLKPPFFMVFDNYQELSSDSPLHDVMNQAFSMIPEGMNAVVISRNDVPASFSRLRASRSIGMVEWEDMRFNEAEAERMLEQGGKLLPRQKILRSLYEISQGWAAGLVLLNEVSGKGTLSHSFTEREVLQTVFDYFAAEVFRYLDPKSQDFFLTTAFLPKMTVQMAKQLTRNESAGNILRDLEANNYFVMRRYGLKITYEYHPLYRQFLLNLAGKTFSPERLSNVRKDAAVLLESEGMTEDAIGLLKEVAGWDIMAGIIIANAPDMIKQGRYLPLQDWIGSLPEAIKGEKPWLLYWEGTSHLPYSPLLAKPLFENAFNQFDVEGDTVGAMLSASGVVTSMAYGFDDASPFNHWYQVLNDLALDITEFPNEEIEAWVVSSIVMAAILKEHPPGNIETWEERALNIEEKPSTLNIKAYALRIVFMWRLLWKGCHEALPLLHELRRLAQIRFAHPVISIVAQAAEVQYSMFTGLHDKLVNAARKGLDLAEQTGIRIEDLWFKLNTAMSCINRADLEGAQKWLDQISPWVENLPCMIRVNYHINSMRIAMIRSEYDRVLQQAVNARNFAVKTGHPHPLCFVQLLLAQLHLLMNNFSEASKCLDQARPHVLKGNFIEGKIEMLRIEALLAFGSGDESNGMDFLEKYLTLTRQCGYYCTALENPALTIVLLEKALDAGIEVEHVREMIRRRGLVPAKPPLHIERWPWYLKIYTFGRFSIVKASTPIRASGKAQQMPRRLLKALIALGGRAISVNTLSELLWPDADGDQAHQSFGTTLHRLRKLLGRAEVIRLNDGKLTLDNRYCWVDVWTFERLLAQADEFEARGMTEKAWVITEKALTLYRNHFLLNEGEESWIIPPAERLKSKYFRRLLRTGHAMEKADQVERAVQLYEKGLELDDCKEELYRRLMVYYMNLGKKGEALALYKRCRKLLSATLGVDPSPETEAVRRAVMSRPGYLRVVSAETQNRN